MLRIDRRVFDTRGCIRLFPVRSNLARLRYPSSWRDPKSSPSVAMFSPRQCRRGTKTTTLSSRRCHRHLRGRNTFPVGGARLPSRSLSRARARFERTSRLLSRIECARHFQSRDDDDDASLPRPPPPPPEAGARRPDASLFLSSRLLPVVVLLLSERGEGGNGFVSLSLSLALFKKEDPIFQFNSPFERRRREKRLA